MDGWERWLLTAAALHLGFQLTVTLLVYPVLVERGRLGVAWAEVHATHSRRITPPVLVVYGALLPPLTVAGGRLVTGEAGWGSAVALLGGALALTATAAVAAPAHGRLARGWDEAVGRRLVHADVVRLLGASVCLAGAAWTSLP